MADTSVSLLERLSLGPDEQSWQQFVDLYAPLIRNWLRRYSVQKQDAEDLAQEVMTVVVRGIADFHHNQQPGAFRNWLRTTTVNQLRVLWRTRRGKAEASGDSDMARMLDQLVDPTSSLSRLWNQQHDEHVIGRLLDLIEPHFERSTWQAFRGFFVDGKKAAAVAAELGISVNAVLLAKSRVLRRLRQESRGLTD